MPDKTTLEEYFKRAEKEGWALGQFNFSDFKILQAIISAAQKMRAPVILGTSEKASKLLGLKQIVAAKRSFLRLFLPLNLDHARSFGYIKEAINEGYEAVHFDGSALSLEENIRETKAIKNYARKFNVFVEGEIDAIGGVSTDPQQASKFVQATQINSFAVVVGNAHGGTQAKPNPKLDLKRLSEIKEALGNVPLVLHGGSGILPQDIKKAIELGVVKINISTELKAVFAATQSTAAVQKAVEDKIRLFGSQNKI